MRRFLPLFAACLFVANCNSTGVPAHIAPTPQPAGYADGTKTLSTEGLIFSRQIEGVVYISGLDFVLDKGNYSYRTTADPNIIIAQSSGGDITLTYDPINDRFVGENSAKTATTIVHRLASSADGQAVLELVGHTYLSTPSSISYYSTSGLETNPTQVAVQSGTATFNGVADLVVYHGANDVFSSGSGTVALTADFNADMISGSMSLADNGSGTPGYEMLPTTIIIDPAAITGNGFSGTFTANPGDLNMASIASTSLNGKFYGVGAADVAGTFLGSGLSADNSTIASIVGGFLAE